jgi:hypothetical protein
VTCATTSNCWAVGFHDTGGFFGSVYQSGPDDTLTERWDGTSWTIVPSPNATTQDNNDLTGVTCTSASDCWAVGFYNPGNSVVVGNYAQRLIEHWDGTSWTLVTSPTDPQGAFFDSVTCTSARECWAVGTTGNGTLIERWDGNSWTVVISANVSGPYYNRLHSVTCVSASDCWAVGEYTTADVFNLSSTLIEHYGRRRKRHHLAVNSSDIAQTQSQSGQAVTSSNFREDVNANGLINSSDIALVQSKSGTGLP